MGSDAGQLLRIESPEIRFPSESGDKTSCRLQVSNETNSYGVYKEAEHQVKKQELRVGFVSPDQPYCPVVKGSEVASPPGSSTSGTGNRSSFTPDALITSVSKEAPGIAYEIVKLSPTASITGVCVDEFHGENLKAKFLEQPTTWSPKSKRSGVKRKAHFPCLKDQKKRSTYSLSSQASGDSVTALDTTTEVQAPNCEPLQEASLLMADAHCQDEEDEELILPEGGSGDAVVQEASLQVMIHPNCQDEEEEEPVLPEGGGSDADDQDHVNQEVDNQDQSGLCPIHGTSDTEAQQDGTKNGEEHLQSASNDARPDIEPSRENQLPFTRTLPIWERIESWEAFRLLPQRPHFRPLLEWPQEIRERTAISFMVSFATLVESIATLQPDVPSDLIDQCLHQLAELEVLGFNVEAAAECLRRLSAIRKRQHELQDKLKDVHVKITKKAKDKVRLEESIGHMDRELAEPASKRARCNSLKQAKEAEVALWRLELSVFEKKVLSAEDEFKSLVSARW